MARVLHICNPTSAYASRRKHRTFDWTREPCPSIMAGGILGINHGQYWIEEDGMIEAPSKTAKPPYRIPLMTEIEQVEPCGLRLVSTFSGCGGSCLGFRMAGYETLMASEFVDAAADVYALNHPSVPILTQDVREVEPDMILAYLGLEVGELDVLEGSPPCASFSTAGMRQASWGEVRKYSDREQRVDDLFFEYVRLLRGLRPKVFIAENVPGLTRGVAKGYFNLILAALKESGYRVEWRLLQAKWLGVPQDRTRVIFQGVRDDLRRRPAWPAPLPYFYTLRDAIPLAQRHGTAPPHKDWQAVGKDVEATFVNSGEEAAPTIVASGDNKGAGWVEVRVPVGAIHDTSGQYSVGDVSDKPCPTITVGVDGLNSLHYQIEEEILRVPEDEDSIPGHPTERRKFTIGELKRVCGFPDDFVLTGHYRQQWERLGRAVPPPMMHAVAEAVRDEVLA